MIKFGPAGLGGTEQAISNLEEFYKLGLKACEIAFTYSVYIKKQDAIKIGKHAKRLNFSLSIHAPYYINLNSTDKSKIEKSKERILKSCEIAHYLNAKRVIFHPGYYGKSKPEETFENIKKQIIEMQEQIKQNKWNVSLCPETTGKKNVFGSIKEISKLVKQTGCGFCIDFAHILAREKEYKFSLIEKSFPQKHWHCHFSGIEFTEKGEKKHIKTQKEQWRILLKNIPKDKDIIIINESPYNIEDSIEGLKIWKGMK